DSLLRSLRSCLDRFPDKRRGINTTYPMGDIGMAAFSVVAISLPYFLAHQRQLEAGHGRSKCTSLFGIAKIPCDTHIRDMLDPVSPALLHPVFAETVDQIRHIDGGLDVFRRLDGRLLIALDGTEYHCSRKIHCRHCSTRLRGKGETEYYHSMLAATLVAPGHDKVIPLEPEFIVPQDGAEKTSCPFPAPGNPGRKVGPGLSRALAWTRQGRSPWNQPVGICGIGLSSLPPMTRGRPEGVTRLAMCNDRGSRRMVWRGASGTGDGSWNSLHDSSAWTYTRIRSLLRLPPRGTSARPRRMAHSPTPPRRWRN